MAQTGSIKHIISNVRIRMIEVDGTRTSSRTGETIGQPLGKDADGKRTVPTCYRVLFDMADELRDVGKKLLHSKNVFVYPTIGGVRINDLSILAAFEEEHKRPVRKNDRLSFEALGDICAPLDNAVGNGMYVIKTREAEETSPGTRDCVLEYTSTSGVSFTPGEDVLYADAADYGGEDVEELPW